MFKTPFKDAVQGNVSKGSGSGGNARNLPPEASGRTGSGEVPEELYCEDITAKAPPQRVPAQNLRIL